MLTASALDFQDLQLPVFLHMQSHRLPWPLTSSKNVTVVPKKLPHSCPRHPHA
ncbi:hypothetical protein DSUL_40077 [Desulfovibrionales bacterium]